MTRSKRRTATIASLGCLLGLFGCIAGGCDAGYSTSSGDQRQQPDDSTAKASGLPFEVWLVDQSNTRGLTYGGTLYIYDGADLLGDPASAVATDVINLAGDAAALCMASTGANPVRPHMLLFDSTHRHAVLSFVASGHVVIIDTESRAPIKCLRTTAGAGGARQAHAAFPAPDDSYILVANQNGKLLERINTDVDGDGAPYESAADIALDPAATLNLATCMTPSGAACQAPALRPDNAPICPIIDSTSSLGFVTVRGGGMFVVDPTATPMAILAEYDSGTVHGNGCGGVQVADSMFINSGGGTGSNLSEFDVYRFPLTGYAAGNPPNMPAPIVVFSDDAAAQDRDSHGAVATKHGEYLWVDDRAGNVVEVFDTETNAWVNTVSLVGPDTADPTPDLVDISPSGEHLFFAFRGPNPLSGDPHVATGSTPGVGVVKITENGRNGFLKGLARISNVDPSGVERADPHGIRVRQTHLGFDPGSEPAAQGPLTLPDDWCGTWEITITARNCSSGELLAIDEYEDLICPGETVGEGLLRLFDRCSTNREGDAFQATCLRSFASAGCDVRQRLDLELTRQSEALSGQGYWFVVFEGECAELGSAPCERTTVEGLRSSPDTSVCVP
jgi:hypothetical protein